MATECIQGTTNEQRIVALERDVKSVKDDIHEIKNGLLKRPSWAVCIIITLLSALSMSLITFSVTLIKMVICQ